MDEMTGTWRHGEERAELVAQLVLANRRARIAEAKVRDLVSVDDRCTALATRVIELEDIVATLNRRVMAGNQKRGQRGT